MDTPWIVGQRVRFQTVREIDQEPWNERVTVEGTVDYVKLGIVTDDGTAYEVRSEEVVSV